MKAIGYFVTFLAALAFGIIFGAWVLWLMWGWFFVPVGLPTITFVQAAGVNLAITALLRSARPSPVNDDAKKTMGNVLTVFIASICTDLAYLGIGLIVRMFM